MRYAARVANVSRQSVYEARKRDSDFDERIRQAETEGAEAIEGKAFAMANAGNERMVILPEKYGRSQKLDMTGDFNAFTIRIAEASDDSDHNI